MSWSKWISKPELQRFYNSEETSDVVLLLPGVPMGRIHAHKVILSAASDDFKMELLQPELLVRSEDSNNVIPEDEVKAIIPAIRSIYGFGFPDMPETLLDVAEVAAIAYGYSITSLFDWVKKISDNLLAGCINDEAKLNEFLAFDRFPPVSGDTPASWRMHDFAVCFMRKNLKNLERKAVFHDLLEKQPKLAVTLLLNEVVFEMEWSIEP